MLLLQDFIIVGVTLWVFYKIIKQVVLWFVRGVLKHWGDQINPGLSQWLLKTQTPEHRRELIRIWNSAV